MDEIREQAADLVERWKAVAKVVLATPAVAAPYLEGISVAQITEVVEIVNYWLNRAKAPKGFAPGFKLARAFAGTSLDSATTALSNIEAGNYNFLPNLVAALGQILAGLHGLMLFSPRDDQRQVIAALGGDLAQGLALVDTAQGEMAEKLTQLKEVAEIAETITEKAAQVSELHDTAVATGEAIATHRAKAAETLESIEQDEAEAEILRAEALKLKTELTELESKIGKSADDLSELQKKSREQSDLIQALLPRAASAGLASSFSLRVKQLEMTKWIWMAVFFVTIIALAIMAFFVIKIPQGSADQVWMYVLHRLPLATPLIWLGWFSAIQYGNTLRVQEDYAFKEATSKAFEGYRSHMEHLAGVNLAEGNNAMALLAAKTIDILGHEPLRIYEKSERDVSPGRAILEAFRAKTGAAGAVAESLRKGASVTIAVKPPEGV